MINNIVNNKLTMSFKTLISDLTVGFVVLMILIAFPVLVIGSLFTYHPSYEEREKQHLIESGEGVMINPIVEYHDGRVFKEKMYLSKDDVEKIFNSRKSSTNIQRCNL